MWLSIRLSQNSKICLYLSINLAYLPFIKSIQELAFLRVFLEHLKELLKILYNFGPDFRPIQGLQPHYHICNSS